jgi:RNase P/RNase MRP subunit p29
MGIEINTGDLVHITRGLYKGRAGRVISKSLNSVSIKGAEGVTTVNKGDVAQGFSEIPLPPEPIIFTIGDRVRINRSTSLHSGKTGTYTGLSHVTNTAGVVELDDEDKTVVLYFSDLVKIPKRPFRVEGRLISYGDIKVGDTITSTSKRNKDGVNETVVRTGTVYVIGPLTIRTREGAPINYSNESTYVLDKAAEPVDERLEELKNYPANTILSFSRGFTLKYTAVKNTNGSWILNEVHGTSQTITTKKLRDLIGSSPVVKLA